MNTKQQSIKDCDLFVTDAPVAREIEIGGQKVEVFVRELPEAQSQQIFMLWLSDDLAKRAEMRGKLILSAICDENGAALFTAAEVARMKPKVAGIFEKVILEVNGITSDAREKSGND